MVQLQRRPRRGSRTSSTTVEDVRGQEDCRGKVTTPLSGKWLPMSCGDSSGQVKRPSATGTGSGVRHGASSSAGPLHEERPVDQAVQHRRGGGVAVGVAGDVREPGQAGQHRVEQVLDGGGIDIGRQLAGGDRVTDQPVEEREVRRAIGRSISRSSG